jgi:hypothetical protein
VKLSESQCKVLLALADPANVDGTRRLRGRGPLASAWKLIALGLACYVGPGPFNGEVYRLTEAGRKEVEAIMGRVRDANG